MSSNKLQSWSWPSSFGIPVSPGIFPDAFPRLEISGNPSHHCENKFHQSRSKLQRLFGSVVQVSTNFAILVSFHFLVALCFLECQVSILEKRMPNSLNCWREYRLVLLKQVVVQKRFLKYHNITCIMRQSRIAARHGSGTRNSRGFTGNVGCSRAARCVRT